MDSSHHQVLVSKAECEELDVHSDILRIVDENYEYRIVQVRDGDEDADEAHMLVSDEGFPADHPSDSSPQYYVISDANLGNVYVNSTQQSVVQPKPSTNPHHQKRYAFNAQKSIAISPKTAVHHHQAAAATTSIPSKGHNAPVAGATSSGKAKKRDERRRVTHNEVERRRRDKINHWIEKLGSIIPVDGQPSGSLLIDRQTMFSSTTGMLDGQSKGGILSKACEYVTALHHKVNTLNDCLKESEKINIESQRLRESNAQLAVENEQLRERLSKLGIRQPSCIVLSTSATTKVSNEST